MFYAWLSISPGAMHGAASAGIRIATFACVHRTMHLRIPHTHYGVILVTPNPGSTWTFAHAKPRSSEQLSRDPSTPSRT
jgi:hypothetical protein